ncbi:MAG TPA: hypothetical protein ENH40_01490 [Nitrospirae bacterium]|nr:hypothetical protein [Nitrospirota bacterium]
MAYKKNSVFKLCCGDLSCDRDIAGFKHLSEAIILQSLEDFWSPYYRDESIEFFTKEGFNVCSKIAGLDTASQSKIINLLGGNKHANTA